MASWPGVARFTMRYTRTIGDDMVNVLHIRRDDLADPDIPWMVTVNEALRDELWDKAAVTTDLKQYTANEVTLADITGVSQDPSNAGLFTQLAVNSVGNASQDPLSPQLAVVVSHRSAFASRSGRGRTYHGGLTALSQTLASSAYPVPSVTFLADLATMWARLDAALQALTVPSTLVIASEADEVAYEVIEHRFPAKFYTQRRRA